MENGEGKSQVNLKKMSSNFAIKVQCIQQEPEEASCLQKQKSPAESAERAEMGLQKLCAEQDCIAAVQI
jgi:hypothetical protein